MAAINASFGSTLQGSLTNAATDTYQLTAAAGGLVTINFAHPAGAGTTGVPIVLTLVDALGNVAISVTAQGNTSLSTTVAAAGTYTLKVADGNIYNTADGGIYTITPTINTQAGVSYDGAANNSTASAISSPMGAAIIGGLNAGDLDVFKLHADSGGVLTVELTHPQGAGSNGVPIDIDVLDEAGNVVTSKSLFGNGSFVTTEPTAGDYYLKIADGNQYAAIHGGTYTVKPTLVTSANTSYDGATNNTTSTAISSPMGTPITGSLNAGDIDMFKVHAAKGGVLSLTLLHPQGAGTNGVPVVVTVLDASGNVVTTQNLYGNATFVTSVADAGDYFLKIADGNQYASIHGGTYTLTPTLSTVAGTTYDGAANNSTTTAITSTMGAPITGSLNAGDTDMFKIHADSGGVLSVAFTHPQGAGTSGVPVEVTVQDADGNVLTTQTLYGNTSFVTTVAGAGDYFLKIADGNEYAAIHGGTYTATPTLTTRAGTTYDGAANNTTSTALSATFGAPITGSLNAGDTDVFKLHANAGGVLSLSLEHPQGVGTSGVPVVVTVLDASGNVVTTQSLSGNATFVTSISNAGDYYLKVADGNEYAKFHGGTYTLTSSLLNQPGVVYDGAANNTTTTALSAPLGTTIMGALNRGDSDYFKFTASSGGTLSLNFSHPDGPGTAGHNITVAISDSSGKTVGSSTLYGSGLLNVALASGGDYYIKVADAAQYASGGDGVYKLFAGMSSGTGISLTGTTAGEKFTSTSGNDLINGGAGQDTVAYTGNSSDYQINVSSVGAQISDSLGRHGSDSLINIERLQFADKSVALDVDGVAGLAYRLYQAAFDRTPDQTGLGFWIAQMDKGYSLNSVASEFVKSQEFQLRYGSNASNKDLVSGFYANVLHRTPDQGGMDFWVGVLDSRAADAASVLASFSTSAENVAQLTGVLSHGITYVPYI